MNEKQQKWINAQCAILKKFLDSIPVLTNEDADVVAGYIAVVSIVATGCESEVRNALFDVVEPYQRKAEEMMKNERA